MNATHTYRATNINPFVIVLLAIPLTLVRALLLQDHPGWFPVIFLVLIALFMLFIVGLLLSRVAVDGQGARFTIFGRVVASRSIRWDEVSRIEYGGRPGRKGRFFKACLTGRRPVFIPIVDNDGKVVFSRVPGRNGGEDALSLEQAVREACGHPVAEVENLFAPARQG